MFPVADEAEIKGVLAPIAARVLLKRLFAARMDRFDLLRAVQGLAARVQTVTGLSTDWCVTSILPWIGNKEPLLGTTLVTARYDCLPMQTMQVNTTIVPPVDVC